ncbi:MAG: alpha-amylase family glycosyl hydrolase [Ardenticatenaceae bacterium]|nr:alpha-amylase family glycosyl hydrolase [Ardenticatenaceae bacterium]
MKKITLFLLLILTMAACQPEAPAAAPSPVPEPTASPAAEPAAVSEADLPVQEGYPWWNDVVFYEVFVRSFYDSDGDGIGDLNGLIEKLDYINDGDPATTDDLGATGIWLMPIAVSPSYHGYDVVDYFEVDPEYGTNEDFKRLMEEAHARDIRVIVDLVMNHTSVEHPWFIESQNPESEKRDWYIWADENPNYRGPDGQVAWHDDPSGAYYGVFWSGMPDLNYDNPEVTAAMYEAAEFWLTEMGVDGFRLDAIKHMIEEGQAQENTRSTHDWLADFYTFYKEVNPEALTVGEAWTNTQQVVEYTGDEVDIAFQFDLALDILAASSAGVGKAFATTQSEVVEAFPPNQYATFITNHDQNRVMSQLKGDVAKARLAASILLTAPGVPFVYYGEEIGMTGTKPDEDIRRPMQWVSDDPGVGFTTGEPWRAPAEDYPQVSVALQENEADSLLNHYRTLIHLRNAHEALRVGEWTLVEPNSGRLYTFLRYTENEVILVIINMNRNPVLADKYSLELAEGPLSETVEAVSLFGGEPSEAPTVNDSGGFSGYVPFAEIPAQSAHIIQLVGDGG